MRTIRPGQKALTVDDCRLLVLQITSLMHRPGHSEEVLNELSAIRDALTAPAYVDVKAPYTRRLLSVPLTEEIKQLGRDARAHPEWLGTAQQRKFILGDGILENFFGIVTGIADDESYVSLILGPTGQEALFFFQTDRLWAELAVNHQTRPVV